jgi:hypothetical protein
MGQNYVTQRETRFSHPDPTALIKLIRKRSPRAVTGEEDFSTTDSVTQWTTMKSGLSADAADRRVRWASLALIGLIMLSMDPLSRAFGGGPGAFLPVVGIILIPLILFIVWAVVYSHAVRLSTTSEGLFFLDIAKHTINVSTGSD